MLKVVLATDASGAAMAASAGMVVVVVDVIDFSTSMEAAIDAGAAAVYGAGPDNARPPVAIDPEKMGYLAGKRAVCSNAGVIVLAEPRSGSEEDRRAGIQMALKGIKSAGSNVLGVLPSIGSEVVRMADMKGLVVLGVTASGGVAFDAAVKAGSPAVLTGTVARTMCKKGPDPARDSAARAIEAAERLKTGIAIIAASSMSVEDLLGAEYILGKILVMRPSSVI